MGTRAAGVESYRYEDHYAATAGDGATNAAGRTGADRLQDRVELLAYERLNRWRGVDVGIHNFNAVQRNRSRLEISEMQLINQVSATSARECGRLKWRAYRRAWLGVRDGIRNYLITAA